MSQASSSSRAAEPKDLSSSRGLTYPIPPSIAHEILHRRIPVLADIMAFSVGIINISKGLGAPTSSPEAWRNSDADTVEIMIDFDDRNYPCRAPRDPHPGNHPFRGPRRGELDSGVKPNQDSNSHSLQRVLVNAFSVAQNTLRRLREAFSKPFRPRLLRHQERPKKDSLQAVSEFEPVQHPADPCDTCRAGVAAIAYKVFLFLLVIFTPRERGKDRRPYISRLDQIAVQSLRDALVDLYDFVQMIQGRECKSQTTPAAVQSAGVTGLPQPKDDLAVPVTGKLRLAERLLERKVGEFCDYPSNVKPRGLDDLLKVLESPWAVDHLPYALTVSSELNGTEKVYRTEEDSFLPVLGSAETILAREMVAPGGIASYTGKTVELGPEPFARGGWSEVYVGTHHVTASQVAVKLVRIFDRGSRRDTKRLSQLIQAEMDVWVLARHPHLLPLYGVHWNGDFPCLVSPWCGNGDIVHFVSRHELSSRFDLALRLLEEVLLGLEYLHTHTPTIVHCDLKGANILISDDGKALIADFGLAAMQATVTETSFKVMSSSSPKGTYRWMARELLFFDDAKPTTSSDIWSFACVVVETLTGRVPYDGLKEYQVLLAISEGELPARPDDANDDLWAALQQCWRLIPADRPSARRLRDMIERSNSV